jgi:hypothetical protein
MESINLRVSVTIVMKNISLGTNVRRINSLWTFQRTCRGRHDDIPQDPLPPPVDDILQVINRMWNPKSPYMN